MPASPEGGIGSRKVSHHKINNILGEARVVNPKSSIFGHAGTSRPNIDYHYKNTRAAEQHHQRGFSIGALGAGMGSSGSSKKILAGIPASALTNSNNEELL